MAVTQRFLPPTPAVYIESAAGIEDGGRTGLTGECINLIPPTNAA